MTYETGLIFFISLLLMWIKPGPAQVLKLTSALNSGFWHAMAISTSSIVVCVGFYIIAALGYGALSNMFEYAGFFSEVYWRVLSVLFRV